jgi:hypothetical protein
MTLSFSAATTSGEEGDQSEAFIAGGLFKQEEREGTERGT